MRSWSRVCLLFQGEMHALMAAVLLGMPGFDAFDGDAEPQPPDPELGQGEQSTGTGKRNAVVGPNSCGQATLAKQTFKCGASELFACGFQRLTQQQVTRSVVGDGERITVSAVAELELAFKIGAP